MTQMSYMDAIWSAIHEEMRRDSRVLVMGQDVICKLFVDIGAHISFGVSSGLVAFWIDLGGSGLGGLTTSCT